VKKLIVVITCIALSLCVVGCQREADPSIEAAIKESIGQPVNAIHLKMERKSYIVTFENKDTGETYTQAVNDDMKVAKEGDDPLWIVTGYDDLNKNIRTVTIYVVPAQENEAV
jgi:hypothetical protein